MALLIVVNPWSFGILGCFKMTVYMGHYHKMEQSLSLMVYLHARCPRFAFSMYDIIIRGALLEPHAISRFRVCYL